MRTKIVTAPIDEPLTPLEARMHLRNPEITTNDAEILRFIKSAREKVENKTQRKLLTQTWDLYLDYLPGSYYSGLYPYQYYGIEMPWAPLQSVTSITYLDTSNVSQTLATTEYVADLTGLMPRIRLAYNKTWPSTLGIENAITIRAVFGYADADSIPETIKHWMLLFLDAADKNRSLLQEREPFLTPFAEGLLDEHRILSV